MRLLIFGDSITQGYYDREGGWADRLRREYMERRIEGRANINVFNLGISGDGSRDILRRIGGEISARQSPGEQIIVMIAIGANDSIVGDSDHSATPDEFESNLHEIIEIARTAADRVILIESIPCYDELSDPTPWDQTISFVDARIREYNTILRRVAHESGCVVFALYDAFAALESRADRLPDGVHPDDIGHQMIYNEILKQLEEVL